MGLQTFQGTQALGAANVAQLAAEAGIKTFVLMSAIGADKNLEPKYASTKAEAEAATREAIPSAVILRPSVLFGPEDAFFTRFALMARFTPILPLIGGLDEIPAHLCRRRRYRRRQRAQARSCGQDL